LASVARQLIQTPIISPQFSKDIHIFCIAACRYGIAFHPFYRAFLVDISPAPVAQPALFVAIFVS
jgi:hypothetical protein